MKTGELVLVHLTDEQLNLTKGNRTTPVPGIVVSVWEGEYPHHPKSTTGVNVRVFTDSMDNPLWLTSLPMQYAGVRDAFGNQTATYELPNSQKQAPTFERTNSAQELLYSKSANFPRRSCQWLKTPAETSIQSAIVSVEALGADKRLSDALFLLSQSQDLVADYIESDLKQ